MLVLTRKRQESVVVGGKDGIHRLLKVTVLQIAGGSVTLGFEVDGEVPVHRLEVWERLRANAEEAREGSQAHPQPRQGRGRLAARVRSERDQGSQTPQAQATEKSQR